MDRLYTTIQYNTLSRNIRTVFILLFNTIVRPEMYGPFLREDSIQFSVPKCKDRFHTINTIRYDTVSRNVKTVYTLRLNTNGPSILAQVDIQVATSSSEKASPHQ